MVMSLKPPQNDQANIAWFTSTRDAIDNADFFFLNIFNFNAAVVTILKDMVENRFWSIKKCLYILVYFFCIKQT